MINIDYYLSILFVKNHPKDFKTSLFSSLTQQIDASPIDIMSSKGANTSFSIRLKLFKDGCAMFVRSNFFGVGPDAFRKHVSSMRSDSMNPHNWWMEILSEYGILVFLGYLIVYVLVIWKLIKGYLATQMAEAGIMIASLLGFFIACVASSSLLRIPAHWLIFGLAIATIGIMDKAISVKADEE